MTVIDKIFYRNLGLVTPDEGRFKACGDLKNR
jgi:hypothetical protein